ncbi:alpha/beta fold hydrolase [Patescibacteria group bacterium]|nr:alpha/beta fold hydrolase [Patescibacteria group bacterium]
MGGQKIIIIIGFFAVILCGANVAQADDITVLEFEGNIFPADYVLTQDRSPYLLDGTFYISSGGGLTIDSGVVLKMDSGSRIVIDGVLYIRGTSENSVIITSDKDDEYGGDTNGDGSASSPAPGNWSGLQVNTGGVVYIDNAIIRYGGDKGASGAMIELYTGSGVQIFDSVIEYSMNGIKMIGSLVSQSSLYIIKSIIRNNTICGIEISGKSSIIFGDNTLNDNACGMRVYNTSDADYFLIGENSFFDNDEFAFEFLGNDTLSIIYNWWGSASGPTHPDNPAGDGDFLIGNVVFSPWIMSGTVNSINSAPVLSFASDTGYESDGVEPNISFVNQDIPVFKVAFSDVDFDVAQYVRLVVGDDSYAMATSVSSTFSFSPSDDVFGKGEYTYHFEASDGEIAVRLPESGELSFDVRFVPVILVPGIMGTELWKGDDLIWPDIVQMISNPGDGFMEVLAMDTDGVAIDSQIIMGDIVRKPVIGKDIFEGLISEFTNIGYQENTNLFVFPYDWRIGLDTSAQSLKQKIDNILSQTGSEKVGIVAHSMGGLISKQYILDNGSDSVDKMIFIGTPHLGAPKSTKTLLIGDNLGVELFFSFLSSSLVKEISQNMLSIYQLLPSQEYYTQIGGHYKDSTQDALFGYNQTKSMLIEQGLNPTLLQYAEDFHTSALDNFDVAGINTYNINGCDKPTMSKIIRRNKFLSNIFLLDEYIVEMEAGDGTVPLESSDALTLASGRSFYFKGVDHSVMPSASGIKDMVTQLISGTFIADNLPSNVTQDKTQCTIRGKLLSIHSPVNLHIYDSEGNHVGRGENGDIEYNISGVAYEEIGENKFVFLPESGEEEYRIELDGTDEGTFSLRVSKVENNEVIETAYYSDIPVNSSSEAVITLSENVSSTVLQVDESGSGSFQTVSVSSVLSSQESEDMTKPITTISTTGGTSSAVFTLSAIDDNSGILKTEYSLDNGDTWNNYANSVIISSIGETTVLYRSKDRAGNLEDYKSETIRVASAPVILTPFINAPSNNEKADMPRRSPSEGGEVLGIKIERSKNEQYSNDDILGALKNADIDMLMDYLGQERDLILEQSVAQKYGNSLSFKQGEINFISYGTKSTRILGTGERAGVLHSFKYAFDRLPDTQDDWDDVIKISTNQIPNQKNPIAEQEARIEFEKIYSREPKEEDNFSIMRIAYGLRPEKRDLEKEIQGITEFVKIYGRVPSSTLDWNILRSIAY